MKEQIINHFLNYEFIYIFLFCSLTFLSLSIIIKKEIIKKISILLFSVFIVLFLFEFVLSFFMEKYEMAAKSCYDAIDVNHSNVIEKQRDTEFVDKISNKKYRFWNDSIAKECLDEEKYIKVFDIEYSIYKDTHFRYTKCNKSSEDTYIFLGCSFVFGDGVKDEETLPYYFSYLFDFKKNVLNFGESGKGINMAMSILNTGLIENKKYNHFFYSLMSDHFNRAFRYDSFVKCYDGYLYKNNQWIIPTIIGKIKYIFSKSYIFRKVFVTIINKYNKQYYENYIIKGLRELKKTIKEKYNSKLTIIVWPDFYPYCTSDDFFENLRKTDLDLIFLPEYFNSEEDGYKIKYDIHPTGKANKEIAQILYNHINNIDNNNKEI